MVKRIISFLLGLGLLSAVVGLGVWAVADQSSTLVISFGVASAVLVPTGFALMGYAFSAGERKILSRLSKVQAIGQLVEQAETAEQKIRVLDEERLRLRELVELEARKQFLIARRQAFESDAIRLLNQLENIEEEMLNLDTAIEVNPLSEEVQQLHEKVTAAQNRDTIVINVLGQSFVLWRKVLRSLPGGYLLDVYVDAFQALTDLSRAAFKQLRRKA